MDSSYESSEDEAEAIAKAMGFSSFGTQGPTKKRKFNPKTDAMVEGQELASLDRGGKKGQGSGGNKIPLGKPRVLGMVPKSNQEEIELDEEDEKPAYIDTSLPPPSKQDDSEEDGGPAYIDTSLPPPNDEARAAQQKIDAILACGTIPPVPPDVKIKVKPRNIRRRPGSWPSHERVARSTTAQCSRLRRGHSRSHFASGSKCPGSGYEWSLTYGPSSTEAARTEERVLVYWLL